MTGKGTEGSKIMEENRKDLKGKERNGRGTDRTCQRMEGNGKEQKGTERNRREWERDKQDMPGQGQDRKGNDKTGNEWRGRERSERNGQVRRTGKE